MVAAYAWKDSIYGTKLTFITERDKAGVYLQVAGMHVNTLECRISGPCGSSHSCHPLWGSKRAREFTKRNVVIMLS